MINIIHTNLHVTEPNPHFMPIHLLCHRAILRCRSNRLDLFPPHPLSPPPPLLPLLTLLHSYLSCLHWFMTWNNLTSVIWYVCYTVHHQYIWLVIQYNVRWYVYMYLCCSYEWFIYEVSFLSCVVYKNMWKFQMWFLISNFDLVQIHYYSVSMCETGCTCMSVCVYIFIWISNNSILVSY